MPLLILIFFILMTSSPACVAVAHASDHADEYQDDGRWMVFTYPDHGYEQVYITGTFTDWDMVPLDERSDGWSIRLRVPRTRQYYHFTVDEDRDRWDAIDPENRVAMNHEEFGWVSVLKYGHEDDEDREDRSERRERRQRKKSIRKELKHGQGITADVSYQRVDGLVINVSDDHIGRDFEPSARWHVNYGFSRGKFGGGLTILQPLAPDVLNFKLSLFDRTMPNNRLTGIGQMENSLAAFFLHEDYMDYHRSKGIHLSLVQRLGDWLRLEGGVRFEDNSGLGNRSVWAFKDGDFITNPSIDEGSLRSIFADLHLGSEFNHLRASYEVCGQDYFEGDFEYERIWAQARGRLPLGHSAGFDARVAAGKALSGSLPLQERFLMGGLGTVRGYGYQSLIIPAADEMGQPFGGDLSLLANAEYFVNLDWDFGVALFYDAGMVWQDADADVQLNDLKSSVGLGLQFDDDDDDSLRIDLIQRLDERDSPITIQFRLNRGF